MHITDNGEMITVAKNEPGLVCLDIKNAARFLELLNGPHHQPVSRNMRQNQTSLSIPLHHKHCPACNQSRKVTRKAA